MPHQHGAEMSDDRQTFVAIEVVKSLARNKPEKKPILKKRVNQQRKNDEQIFNE